MPYFRNNVCRFVILFEGRTGSTYLIESLDSHPNVRALLEMLVGLRKDGAKAQLEWARKALTPRILGRYGAIGFKTKLRDIINPTEFAELLREMHVRIIYMQRRNRIKAVISMINSRRLKNATNDYNLYSQNDRLAPITMDLDKFDDMLLFREKLDSKLEAYVNHLKLPTMTLYYEDLWTDDCSALKSTYNFLGFPFKQTQGKCLKNTSDDLREVIINFDELRSRYIGTPYESMFDEITISKKVT